MSGKRDKSIVLLDARVIAYIKHNHNSQSAVLVALAEHGFLKRNPVMSIPEIMIETGLGQRAIEINLKALRDAGMVVQAEKGWAYPYSVNKFPRASIPVTTREAVFKKDGYACIYCGATENLCLDHCHPHSKGGADAFDNLVTACRSCNSSKGTKEVLTWVEDSI